MRSERRRVAGCAIVCGALLAAGPAHAAGETDPSVASDAPGWWRGGDGLRLPGIGAEWHIYRKDGLRVDRSDGLMQMRFNANFWIDSGDLRANAPVEAAFPSYAGTNSEFTRARFTARGRFLDAGDFKFQLDLAQKAQVKDAWLRFDPLPVLGRVRAGNMREPLSIENQTHGGNLTFMSRALPVLAFAPGRNIGVVAANDAFDGRLNWAIGWFWNTTSYDNFGGAADALSESIGSNVVGRVTGLARDSDDGRELIHLGLAFAYQRIHAEAAFRALPETKLTDDHLVDTGKFRPSRGNLANVEFASVSGPWSVQAEAFRNDTDLGSQGGTRFYGGYAFVSYLFTGESRRYDRSAGAFDGVRPRQRFDWGSGGWGAWEAAFRISYVDLNDGPVSGGRQTDYTAGLNWYLSEDLRVLVNYVHGRVEARSQAPAIDGGRTSILQARFAIVL